jgi:hypothetical protein
MDTNRKGAIAEMKIATAATQLGIPVLRPMTAHGRYDLAFEIADQILRVQCKWGALDEQGVLIKVNLQGCRHTPNGYVYSFYGENKSTLSPSTVAASIVATFCPYRWLPEGARSICAWLLRSTDNALALI